MRDDGGVFCSKGDQDKPGEGAQSAALKHHRKVLMGAWRKDMREGGGALKLRTVRLQLQPHVNRQKIDELHCLNALGIHTHPPEIQDPGLCGEQGQ